MNAEAKSSSNNAHSSFSPMEVREFISKMAMKVDLPQEQVDRLCEIWQQKAASGFFQSDLLLCRFTKEGWINLPPLYHNLLATIFVHTGESIRQDQWPPDLVAKYKQMIIDIRDQTSCENKW